MTGHRIIDYAHTQVEGWLRLRYRHPVTVAVDTDPDVDDPTFTAGVLVAYELVKNMEDDVLSVTLTLRVTGDDGGDRDEMVGVGALVETVRDTPGRLTFADYINGDLVTIADAGQAGEDLGRWG